MDFDVKDKLYIITGASSGLGRESAKLLDSMGAKVVAIARSEDKLQNLKNECKNLEYKIFDFKSQDGIKELIDSIVKEYGKVNGMAYFAGVANITPLRSIDIQQTKEVFNINFFSCLEILKCLFDKRKSDNLSAVLIASQSLTRSVSSMSIYDSSKGALNSLAVSLVKDFAKYNFRINSILPAHIETEMTNTASLIRSDTYNNELENTYPLGLGKCKDIAYMCAFLLSPLSSWITGQRISVDGGRGVF